MDFLRYVLEWYHLRNVSFNKLYLKKNCFLVTSKYKHYSEFMFECFKNDSMQKLERFLKLPRISVLWFESICLIFSLTGMMSSNLNNTSLKVHQICLSIDMISQLIQWDSFCQGNTLINEGINCDLTFGS